MKDLKKPNKIITRKQARTFKLKHYYTGTPCLHGHINWRHTKNGGCSDCVRARTKHRYRTNQSYKDECKRTAKKHYEEVGTKWYHENSQRASELNKAWREKHKKEFSIYCKQWRRNNLAKLSKNTSAYRAAKLEATPTWADEKLIEHFYVQATQLTKQTGIKHAVDHIVPLNSKTVCGLHVPSNLQILTRSENSSKNNINWPDKP